MKPRIAITPERLTRRNASDGILQKAFAKSTVCIA